MMKPNRLSLKSMMPSNCTMKLSVITHFYTISNSIAVPAKSTIDVQRAVEARKAQGSVLEYGLKWHLEKFVDAVKQIQFEKLKNL
jgi:hypothetical protein